MLQIQSQISEKAEAEVKTVNLAISPLRMTKTFNLKKEDLEPPVLIQVAKSPIRNLRVEAVDEFDNVEEPSKKIDV